MLVVTLSLNTSLHSHAQTLSLLALQRSTPNLPFQLISPGRTLLKRGTLVQVERSEQPREREFLLFSDCLIWLASEESEKWGFGWSSPSPSVISPPSESNKQLGLGTGSSPSSPKRPHMARSRSKSENELPRFEDIKDSPSPIRPSLVTSASQVKSRSSVPKVPKVRRHASSSSPGQDEKMVYKGRAELVDLEVVITPGEEQKMEVLGPDGSFVLYAGLFLSKRL